MELSQSLINASISNAGYYHDCVPTLVISISKSAAEGLPYKEKERVPVLLIVGGTTYKAGIRAGANTPNVKISADLTDERGNSVRLADILLQHGYQPKEKVKLQVQDGMLILLPPHN